MSSHEEALPSWRPGAARESVLTFLEASAELPVEARVACFDNDGTLWCERPNYVQLDFFLAALTDAVGKDEALGAREEYAALLAGDLAKVGELGLPRIALALTELFEGMHPDRFTEQVREFMDHAMHPTLSRSLRRVIYQPMLELIDELRRRDFSVTIVTGGGTEFVRAISQDLYGVPPEAVVGTLIEYDFSSGDTGPVLARSKRLVGGANEGATKVVNIQTQLGRPPVMAAGNSDGDREMLEWATSTHRPGLALLVDHDDGEREFDYSGHSATLGSRSRSSTRPLGWIGPS
ncbi:HAD family hydrolase [Nocardioides alcanivorans]|uniref:HAD family hydrolase n=1 Tax=Nocardioides alcanivorans TaxID=2897352 RepID=UPI001F34C0BF|nr:HAD family hydrolase [Nocardioides alcanivorans]